MNSIAPFPPTCQDIFAYASLGIRTSAVPTLSNYCLTRYRGPRPPPSCSADQVPRSAALHPLQSATASPQAHKPTSLQACQPACQCS